MGIKRIFIILSFVTSSLLINEATAITLPLSPLPEENVVGDLSFDYAKKDESLLDIARRHNIGHDHIIRANPTVNRWLPGEGTRVLVPSRFILPDTPRDGIVVNLPEMRLYYYPPEYDGRKWVVMTYPVSIGRMDWKTPLGKTTVVKKDTDPPWYPPKSIKIEHAALGETLPDFIPGGHPENPLGRFALRLGFPAYLIHGTDERKAAGIGMRVTHGCLRMYPENIEELFSLVPVGTTVHIVDQPLKIGFRQGKHYLEVHQPFEEDEEIKKPPFTVEEVKEYVKLKLGSLSEVDEATVARVASVGNGVPIPIARHTIPPARQ